MEIRENIKAYHCNDKLRCEKFISDYEYWIHSSEAGPWLGSGMYFWDNLGNALYWKSEKIRKSQNKNEIFLIVSANIFLDKMLDLTDRDICTALDDFWVTYSKAIGIQSQSIKSLGKKLNILFQTKAISNNYDVIKILGDYRKEKCTPLYSFNAFNKKTEPTLASKVIYNVKNPRCITNRKLID